MDAFTDFFPTLLVISVVLFAGLAVTPVFSKLGLPGPAAFLAVGIIAGLVNVVPTDRLGALPLEEISSL